MQASGLARNAAYLIRPDGYIGCASAGADVNALDRYAKDWELRSRA